MLTTEPIVYTFACFTAVTFAPMSSARAWGDEGHETIPLIAEHYLTPAATTRVDALLAADSVNTITEHNIASEATWPVKYREHGGAAETSLWHYANIEVSTGDVAAACFEIPTVSGRLLASDGPAKDCVIDIIDELEPELVNAATPAAEKVLALKYLVHFVGDVHQPLHSADKNDRGGKDKLIAGKFSHRKASHLLGHESRPGHGSGRCNHFHHADQPNHTRSNHRMGGWLAERLGAGGIQNRERRCLRAASCSRLRREV